MERVHIKYEVGGLVIFYKICILEYILIFILEKRLNSIRNKLEKTSIRLIIQINNQTLVSNLVANFGDP